MFGKLIDKMKELFKKWFNKETAPSVPEKPADPATPSGEPMDVTKIKWLGPNGSNAIMEQLINSANMDNSYINTSYKAYSWPKNADGGCDAICCLFYETEDGSIMGGKFDWWRVGGQGRKGLENVHGGYGGHKFPAVGKKVWTCIVSVDCKKRSNVVEVVRK